MVPSRYLQVSGGVIAALDEGRPVVALESTVIAHGLPRPQNLETARLCEQAVREEGAIPATIGIIEGQIVVGLDDAQLELLALSDGVRKVSRRDFGIALARREHGATTVAGTMFAAHLAGIKVFATGGIGGVHRGDAWDVSADLQELGRTPVAVVCAGAKSILDIPRTLEYLETMGVPVLGYQTDTFPAFYASSSGLPVDARVETPEEAAEILCAAWSTGHSGGVVIAAPPPAHLALPAEEMERAVQNALRAAESAGVSGKALTPFLLGQISKETTGRSLLVNIGLLEQNARIAAGVAIELARLRMIT
ncbi:MAG: pseudouridine-5'-phosphate glycosidase [Anaerolineae bacterium]